MSWWCSNVLVVLKRGHEARDVAASLQVERFVAGEGDGQLPPRLAGLRAYPGDAGEFHTAEVIVDLAEHRVCGPNVQHVRRQADHDGRIERSEERRVGNKCS